MLSVAGVPEGHVPVPNRAGGKRSIAVIDCPGASGPIFFPIKVLTVVPPPNTKVVRLALSSTLGVRTWPLLETVTFIRMSFPSRLGRPMLEMIREGRP